MMNNHRAFRADDLLTFLYFTMGARAMEDEISLVIGKKAWSSWSLRPWLAIKATSLAFREVQVPLRQPDTAAGIARHSPSGRVPVLKHGAVIVWDSLAICEYLAELAPEAGLWPEDAGARAAARAISAEMHSGFQALRQEFPMDIHARIGGRAPSEQARADITRIVSIWCEMRHKYEAAGPFLFGAFTIADAMYAPVATRFRTYGIDPGAYGGGGGAASYAQTVLSIPAMAEWGEGAARD
jgi:glutathione S-transferase